MSKPPSTPPSGDHGSESEESAKTSKTGAAEEQEVSRRGSAGRPPQTKQ